MMKLSTARRKELVSLGIGLSTVQGWVKKDKDCPTQGRVILDLLDSRDKLRRENTALNNELRALILRTAKLLKS